MCGIAGFAGEYINRYPLSETMERMIAPLDKRGPDANGVWVSDFCALGHTRLSIIDLAGGAQPMQDETGRYTIVFNGEIYNYRQLREKLNQRGYSFATSSDTEVLLKAYIHYGSTCVQELDGMFAFAVWDSLEKLLFLARDPFGKKPLYYMFDAKGNIFFASEIKALAATGFLHGKIDLKSIDWYLTLLYIPPWRTAYKNVFPIEPGHTAEFYRGKITKRKYWNLAEHPSSLSFSEAQEHLRDLLEKAVKKRLVADVEVGTFLSGGLDSTIVTALAQLFSSHPIKAFSAGFGSALSELPFAKQAAQKHRVEHITLSVGDSNPNDADIISSLEEVCRYYDNPFADSSNIPTYLLAKETKKHVTVALSGDGADEIFLGYKWYRRHMHEPLPERIWHRVSSNPYREYVRRIQYFSFEERKRLWQYPVAAQNYSALLLSRHQSRMHPVKRINALDMMLYLPGDILTKVDRSSMMASLEVRSPFLDKDLVRFVYSLPLSFKMNKWEGKRILKETFRHQLPDEIYRRKKQGFGAPIVNWLARPAFEEYARNTLLSPHTFSSLLFRQDSLKQILNEWERKRNPRRAFQIWTLLCLEGWARSHLSFFAA